MNDSRKLKWIDGAKFIAILAVMIDHTTGILYHNEKIYKEWAMASFNQVIGIQKPYVLKAPFWTVDTLFYCIPNDGYDLDFTNCLFQNVDWKKKDEKTKDT